MSAQGWKRLLVGAPWFRGADAYPLPAYSEFMPAPRLLCTPQGEVDGAVFAAAAPHGFGVSEFEEAVQLRPGLERLAAQLVAAMDDLGHGRPGHGLSRNALSHNPYWPDEFALGGAAPAHERYVVLAALALTRTQDDKGRVRWTLFGASEQGPAAAFWQSFYQGPGRERAANWAQAWLLRLLGAVYGESALDLRRAGFRVHPAVPGDAPAFPGSARERLPSWTAPLLWGEGDSLRGVRYVLSFRPFDLLPQRLRAAYLGGEVHLLPFPASLLFWGVGTYLKLRSELPAAMQIPLLRLFARSENPVGLRVPQSGWLEEPRPGKPAPAHLHGASHDGYVRSHRWERVGRYADPLAAMKPESKLSKVLFSTTPEDLGLYGKPMARNVQLWTDDGRLLLDGPRASRAELAAAALAVDRGGLFGYRFLFPAMQVGRRELVWHRPLVAWLDHPTGGSRVPAEPLLGYITATRPERPKLVRRIELWPRIERRPPLVAAMGLFDRPHDPLARTMIFNVRKLLDSERLLDAGPLPRSFARSLLTADRDDTLEQWFAALPRHADDAAAGRALAADLARRVTPAATGAGGPSSALTFQRTATRAFELAHWRTMATLAAGRFVNKDNADCVRDAATEKLLRHRGRDLEALGEHLLDRYERQVVRAGMKGKALVGDLPFSWRTDFDYAWSGGWCLNQDRPLAERNVILVIPGHDRRRAVIMGDHYDTAYMEDVHDRGADGSGARIAAAGADDNHSATSTLLQAAPIFLELSRAGKLGCDVWLVHLTGEEFPSDCLGARDLCQHLVQGTLSIRLRNGRRRDLSRTRVEAAFVLDMVAHNNDKERDVFQIAPGSGPAAMRLALLAHGANRDWNAATEAWNRRPARRAFGRGRRSADGRAIPAPARHLALEGQVRPRFDPRSALYNTDGQIFSDAGIPVVLLMENYDINREGYHDTHDTMANIDLDYGAALSAIAIETVARATAARPRRRG